MREKLQYDHKSRILASEKGAERNRQPWRVHGLKEACMTTTCKHVLFTRIGAPEADVWNMVEKNESGKRDRQKKRGQFWFGCIGSAPGRNGTSEEECGRGLQSGFGGETPAAAP